MPGKRKKTAKRRAGKKSYTVHLENEKGFKWKQYGGVFSTWTDALDKAQSLSSASGRQARIDTHDSRDNIQTRIK